MKLNYIENRRKRKKKSGSAIAIKQKLQLGRLDLVWVMGNNLDLEVKEEGE